MTEECILVRLRRVWYCSYLCYICYATLQTFFSSSKRKHFPIILQSCEIQEISCEIHAISCEIVGHWGVLKGWRGANKKKKKKEKKEWKTSLHRQSLSSLRWCNPSPVWAQHWRAQVCTLGSAWTYPVSPHVTGQSNRCSLSCLLLWVWYISCFWP